jgi:hypothetical protein
VIDVTPIAVAGTKFASYDKVTFRSASPVTPAVITLPVGANGCPKFSSPGSASAAGT